jgi:hypothetical protein
MKIIVPVIAFIIGFGLAAGLVLSRAGAFNQKQDSRSLADAKSTVERQLKVRYDLMQEQLEAFARTVAGDQDFSMKLVAEQDRSSAEVSEIAQRYLLPMNFSLLRVVDSADIMLSCGHFPASAGNPVSGAVSELDSQPVFVTDNVQGDSVLTLQARISLSIAEVVPLACIGGVVIDEAFLSRLTPYEGIRLILKKGEKVIGAGILSVSELTGNTMVVNDTSCLAAAISLPYAGGGEPPVLYVVVVPDKRNIAGSLL